MSSTKATKPPRTKSFTGCWTCRSRRVKCDETKPLCRRCQNLGIQCQGYGVRLNWSPSEGRGDAVEKGLGTRRARRIMCNANLNRLPSPEIDAMLERIDECPAGESRSEGNYFSVFSVCQPTPGHSDSIPPSEGGDDSQLDVATEPEPIRGISPSPSQDGGTLLYQEETVNGTELTESTYTPDDVVRSTEICTSSVDTWAAEAAHSTVIVGQPGAGHSSIEVLPELPSLPSPRHLDILSMPDCQRRLMHHWVTFTSRKLVLIDEGYNPCRTLMLPTALKGLELNKKVLHANMAIFHGVCAGSAYNLYELGGRKRDEDLGLGIRHSQEAIRHLRNALTQENSADYQTVAMAITACIAVEAISGTTRRWRAHVADGLAYLGKMLASKDSRRKEWAAFHHHLVTMAILCDIPVPPEMKKLLHEAESLELPFPYYGASGSFLLAHDRINSLAHPPLDTQPPSKYYLDAFDLQLYLDFPAMPSPGSKNGSTTNKHAAIVHHMAEAFYYGNLVFFHRTVRRFPPSSDTIQSIVDFGIAALEAMEVSPGPHDEIGSPMLWPALVLGADCHTPESRERMRAWLKKKLALGFRNVVVLGELTDALWARRDAAGPDLDITWQDITAEERFDVFRL